MKKQIFLITGLLLIASLLAFSVTGCGGAIASLLAATGTSATATALAVTNQSAYGGAAALSLRGKALTAKPLPADLELNIIVSNMALSDNGTDWYTLFTDATTINVLDTSATASSGISLSAANLNPAIYKYMKFTVTSIKFASGG
ncbi:MAG: hypothetical protein ABIH00_07035, partial [Armatimonadota bacterium]